MTGLDAGRDVIVEIATLVTDDDLAVVAEGPDLVVSGPPRPSWRPWTTSSGTCTPSSGLLEEIRASDRDPRGGRADHPGVHPGPRPEGPHRAAGRELDRHRPPVPGRLPPEIEEYLHYRSVDVSTVKELAARWYPEALAGAPKKAGGHRAMDDIRESRGRAGVLPLHRLPATPPPSRPQGPGPHRHREARPPHAHRHRAGAPDGRGRPTGPTPGAPVPAAPRSTATLTAPGGPFEMEDVVVRGVPHPHVEVGPGHPPRRVRAVRPPRGQGLPRLRGRAGHVRGALPDRGRPGPPARRPVRHPARRPGGHRHAEPARVGHGLLGHDHRRGGGRPPQRLVDRARSSPTAWPTPAPGWSSSTRSARAASATTSADLPGLEAMIVTCEEHDPDSGGRAPAVGGLLDRGGAGPLPVVPFAEVVGTPADDATLVGGGHRPRRRRHHLLHLGHHRPPKGAVGTHRNSVLQPDEPVLRVHRGRHAPDGGETAASPGARTPTCCRSRSSTPRAATPCW